MTTFLEWLKIGNYLELFLKHGWRTFRTFLEAKAEKYGRDFKVISRWEPTSQICSSCGFKGGKLDLSIREWECLNCGTKHDRDENAAINILVAGGQSETLNGQGGKHETTAKVAAACEMSTRRGAKARQESPRLTAGEDVNWCCTPKN